MKKILMALLLTTSMSVVGCTGVNPTLPNGSTNGTTQTDMVTIDGLVTDPSENPVADVKITVKENNKVLGTTTSDAKGTFSIKVPKTFDGSYIIDASKNVSDGSLSQSLVITAGQKANFTGNDKLVKTVVASNPVPIP